MKQNPDPGTEGVREDPRMHLEEERADAGRSDGAGGAQAGDDLAPDDPPDTAANNSTPG